VLDPDGIVISRAAEDQFRPSLAFNGTDFLVVWEDNRGSSNPDIYGAWVSPAGIVAHEGSVVIQEGNQLYPSLASTGGRLFLVYQGWVGTIGEKLYNTNRIWGVMNPAPGIEETMDDERVTVDAGPTIVRGVLVLGAVDSRQSAEYSRQNTAYRAELLDAAGRKVMDLRLGANDVGRLAPGVYFVRAVSCKLSAVSCSKVVITR